MSLQPGNGSTDLIVGAFWQHGARGDAMSYFAQTMLQASIRHMESFKPGNQINHDAALRIGQQHQRPAVLPPSASITVSDLHWHDNGASRAPLSCG